MEYSLDFSTLAAESGWNNSALRAVYLKGLNKELVKELACCAEVTSLDNLTSTSIKLNNILRETDGKNKVSLPSVLPPCTTVSIVHPVPLAPNTNELMEINIHKLSLWERELKL